MASKRRNMFQKNKTQETTENEIRHTLKSPKPKKKRVSKSMVKTMLIVVDAKGLVHKEFLPQGQILNTAYYKDVLERLLKMVLRVRNDIATTWVLHLNNAPSHTALQVREAQLGNAAPTPLQSRHGTGRLFPVP
ncbi:hypothetical protein AAG570_003369 [Ranatra chinensis]|uniref:Transposase n=1 Tax=Ranatra chinensis TaxID=642074 RepID=A0ABD0Y3E1_9HEMI